MQISISIMIKKRLIKLFLIQFTFRLQDKVNESKIIIQNLERDVTRLRQDKLELNSDLEVLKSEKKNLQLMLETEIDDKKRLTDQINKLTIIGLLMNVNFCFKIIIFSH